MDWMRRPLDVLDECRARFGPVFTLRFIGGRDYVLFTRPDDVKTLFQMPAERFATANRNMVPFMGEHSLFTLEREGHRRHRRLIGPALRGDRLAGYAPLIDELVARDLPSWPRGRAFPVIERMRDVTLRVIIRAIFGVSEPARTTRLVELVHALASGPNAMLAFLPPLQIDAGRFSPWGRFLRQRGELHAILADEVRAARQETAPREDILARLTREGQAEGDTLSDDEILGELVTLLFAGHETSTVALAWAWQWILGDAAVHTRVRDEVRGVVGGGALDAAALERMPYLEAAVHETLRISPIVPIVPRLLAGPATIGGVELPAGAYPTACAYLTQREPDLYPEPERFDPTRFLGVRPSPFAYYPFGGGHRHCIGAFFAVHTMRAVIAAVVARADLERPDTRPQRVGRSGITVMPATGTPVVLQRIVA
jgi:cytochrome P450